MEKRGQIAIWVILSLVLVGAITLFFALEKKPPITSVSTSNSKAFIEKCTTQAVYEAVDLMLPQGGYLNPSNFKLYQNNKINYLCYNQGYYKTCINQEPMFIQHLKQEIKDYITPKVEQCFNLLKQDSQKRKYDVAMSETNSLNVELNNGKISVEINKTLNLKKNEDQQKYDKFSIEISSSLYNLGIIGQEIANQESKFCYFEYLGYMLLYPNYNIEKIDLNGEVKIYKINEKSNDKEKLWIAIRSCAMPPGGM